MEPEGTECGALDAPRLQRALAAGQVMVWERDLDTDLVACSEGARDFFGIDVGHVNDFRRVLHPDDEALVAEASRASIEDGAPYDASYRIQRPEGGWRWVRSHGRVERDDAGRACRVLGMTVDITDQKRAEDVTRLLAHAGEVLGTSLDYQATLAGLAEVVVPIMADWYALDLVSAEGVLERVAAVHPDPARVELARELHRRYPPRRDGPGPWRIMDSGQVDWAASISDEQLEQGAQDAEHLRLVRTMQLRSYICVPLVARGATIGLLTLVMAESGRHYTQADVDVAMDLARRAAVAVDNARLFEQLQQADRRKDEFLAMLAHELRNPLAPISTAAQLLRMADGGDPTTVKASEIITRQVAHMTELVDDLLDVSRVTRGLIQLECVPLDLREVVAGAVEQVQASIDSKAQKLEIDLGQSPLPVNGDRARLVQVVSNLLSNASKYTPVGGDVRLQARRVPGRIAITVADTGMGIEPSLMPHVFELFTQGRRTPDRSQGGLGIGLALVRSIVRLHGGEVTAHSEGPGKGSRFDVWLPSAELREDAGDQAPMVADQRGKPRRILVVDDNQDAARVLADVLTMEGHRVQVALSGREALALAAASSFDTFILDIGLPDMTGYELASSLLSRAKSRSQRPLMIALTGYGQPEDRERSNLVGFDHHLVKPADVGQLLALLGQAQG